MNYLAKATEMYALMEQGQMMEAFEKFYHEEVVQVEADGTERKGKATNRDGLLMWLESLQEIHGGGTDAITANEETGVTMIETWIDVTFKNGHRLKMEEVCVQRWKGDLIIHERFYYNMPPMA